MTTAALGRGVVDPARSSRGRLDALARTLAGSALWLALLLVTYWWATGGGIQDLSGWVTGLTSLGRLTGLTASVLLLAQVLLMARVPFLERAYGQDRLARIHRLVGFTSFNLMLTHIVLITWGYALGSVVEVPQTFWNLVVDYPGMLLALGGTAALVMVAVTSVKAARRRLRYESWHLIHLYAYLGVGLALPHQLWTGTDFTSSPGRTFFWWTAWAVAAGAVLVCRVGVPLWTNLRHDLRVTSVVPEAAWGLVGLPQRPADAPAASRARPVPGLAVPGPAGLDPSQPVLALRRPRRAQPAHHRRRRRGRQRGGRRAHAGYPRAGRGAVRPADRPGSHPRNGSPTSAPAWASPRCAPSPRARRTRWGEAVLFQRFTDSRCSATSSACSGPSAACRSSSYPGAAGTTGRGSATARTSPAPTTRPCCAPGCPTSPSATSTSADRPPGPMR